VEIKRRKEVSRKEIEGRQKGRQGKRHRAWRKNWEYRETDGGRANIEKKREGERQMETQSWEERKGETERGHRGRQRETSRDLNRHSGR
jgi:hypothetical protein